MSTRRRPCCAPSWSGATNSLALADRRLGGGPERRRPPAVPRRRGGDRQDTAARVDRPRAQLSGFGVIRAAAFTAAISSSPAALVLDLASKPARRRPSGPRAEITRRLLGGDNPAPATGTGGRRLLVFELAAADRRPGTRTDADRAGGPALGGRPIPRGRRAAGPSRTRSIPLLVVAPNRSDELYPRIPHARMAHPAAHPAAGRGGAPGPAVAGADRGMVRAVLVDRPLDRRR
jgi:hypothetical protein